MWTDDDRTLATTYEAVEDEVQFFVNRVTVVLDAQGRLRLRYVEGTGAQTHPGAVLEDCALLFGS